jgi:hypothetical protein
MDPESRPELDLMGVVAALARHRVRWVLTGSLVLAAYGAEIEPGDIDVTPALDEANLQALAHMADELDAIPAHVPDWPRCPPLGWHRRWSPWPATVENLDHLLVTTVGMVDLVPSLCGTFESLAPEATRLRVGDHRVLIADPTSVLARVGQRRKDDARADEFNRMRTQIDDGTACLVGLDRYV